MAHTQPVYILSQQPNQTQCDISQMQTTSGLYTPQPVAYPAQLQIQNDQIHQLQGNNIISQNIPSMYSQQSHYISQFPQLPNKTHTDEWTTVDNPRKRNRNSPDQRTVKQTRISDYWLNPSVVTSNRFSNLENEENKDKIENETNQHKKIAKPPPIFVQGVKSISPLTHLLETIAKDNYELKVLGSEQVKIQAKSSEIYSTIIKALEQKKTEFHSYQPKQTRAFRTVLKNMHPSADLVELKKELEELGHTVVNIWNIHHFKTKAPLPMFFVDIQPAENNKKIYEIDRLLNYIVSFEPPKLKRQIPQCARCQRYGHTKSYCHLRPRCIKCTGDHSTADCQRKEKSDNVQCVLCEGNHPANYKGCKVYKDLMAKKYPPLRPKQNLVRETHLVQPNITYAHIVNPQQEQPPLINTTNQPTTELTELKIMIKDLVKQMGTIMNLLTTVVQQLTK